jgi:alpha-L-arabinofuranosidase
LATVVKSPLLEAVDPNLTGAALDVVANRSEDGKSIFIKLSNADLRRNFATTIVLGSKRIDPEAEEVLLSGATPESMNDFAHPDVIYPRTTTLHCATSCTLQMPPDSVAVLTIRLQ